MPSPGEHALELHVERTLRKKAGLDSAEGLYPGCGQNPFRQQAEAVAFRRLLIDKGEYSEEQVGVFAQEVGDGGKRCFHVETLVGFAMQHAPLPLARDLAAVKSYLADDKRRFPSKANLPHMYEVILEDRPCWLYFDLEYHKTWNPDLNEEGALEAFRSVLASFCDDVLGAPLDKSSMIELESSSPEKFSMHVLVRSLLPPQALDKQQMKVQRADTGTDSETGATTPSVGNIESPDGASAADRGLGVAKPGGTSMGQSLAFANNAQAGLLVEQLVAYASARRREDPKSSPARLLFVRSKPAKNEDPSTNTEVSLIDQAVYTRNRCFRLLFHSKFGKTQDLKIAKRGDLPLFPPAGQLLSSMVSFVPAGTALFSHPVIPEGYGHAAAKVTRLRIGGGASGGGCRSTSTSAACYDRPIAHSGLMQFLVEVWDGVRKGNEVSGSTAKVNFWRPTTVSSAVEVSSRFLAVTLEHNRFCFCKGASHKSNNIYLVVDRVCRTFHQKCHDASCRHFMSPTFEVPSVLLEDEEDEEEEEMLLEAARLHALQSAAAVSVAKPVDTSTSATEHSDRAPFLSEGDGRGAVEQSISLTSEKQMVQGNSASASASALVVAIDDATAASPTRQMRESRPAAASRSGAGSSSCSASSSSSASSDSSSSSSEVAVKRKKRRRSKGGGRPSKRTLTRNDTV
eukprot:TRINITY_DN67023_c0_g1_i1.p1 TRINITY_DN67023_c0_g1~~TRINITY_DN67023_c0_g1_i1.p1  ORF type:complete len:684 (-),score=121.82 TRINITY_DN67023_c0_g1_i1:143-2194(-)